jgi:hypothetical protein
MVNDNERIVAERYMKEGWKCIRGGFPDFVFVKDIDGNITDWRCVEVKSKRDRLSWEQSVIKKLLISKGIDYKVEVV